MVAKVSEAEELEAVATNCIEDPVMRWSISLTRSRRFEINGAVGPYGFVVQSVRLRR
jgi:hypothetical protein